MPLATLYLLLYTYLMIKLIIGLGNPDPEYQNTRHNIGFQFLDYLAKKIDSPDFEFEKKFNASAVKGKIDKVAVLLAKPHTYVNKSGESAAKIKTFLKIKPTDLILIHDDLDIPFGYFKISFGKSSGGHKGVGSVMKAVKSKEFYRIRIGLANSTLKKARSLSDAKRNILVRDFVLSKFTKKETEAISRLFKEIYERLLETVRL